MAYDALSDPTWNSVERGGPLRWMEFTYAVVALVSISNVAFLYIGALRTESRRRLDVRTHARARLQRDEAMRIVSNFLPAAVVQAMHERGNSAEVTGGLTGADGKCCPNADACFANAIAGPA